MKIIYKFILCSIVFLHAGLISANAVAFFVLPFLEPWYIAAPICTAIARMSFSPNVKCPVTLIENKIRKRIGLKEIDGFAKHYFLNKFK